MAGFRTSGAARGNATRCVRDRDVFAMAFRDLLKPGMTFWIPVSKEARGIRLKTVMREEQVVEVLKFGVRVLPVGSLLPVSSVLPVASFSSDGERLSEVVPLCLSGQLQRTNLFHTVRFILGLTKEVKPRKTKKRAGAWWSQEVKTLDGKPYKTLFNKVALSVSFTESLSMNYLLTSLRFIMESEGREGFDKHLNLLVSAGVYNGIVK